MEIKKMKNISIILLSAILFAICSCDDFLDQAPDQRMEIKTAEELSQMMVYAYNRSNYAMLCELSSDNMIDNQSPDMNKNGQYFNVPSYDRMWDEVFAWEDVVSSISTDSPSMIWEECYHAIAVCNHALEVIEKIEADNAAKKKAGNGKDTIDVRTQKGEALISRAYHHFILVNIFSQAYKDDNQTDLGIPYMSKTETEVMVKYNRGTVPEVYKNIEKDIEAGIGLIDDTNFKQEKYHFNTRAAHAFAARFYLFYKKWQEVIDHANLALGANPTFRDWKNGSWPTAEAEGYWWINDKSDNNLLLISSYSVAYRVVCGYRYGCARDAYEGALRLKSPIISNINLTSVNRLYYRRNQDLGSWLLMACYEFFEYTDKVQGIGYAHTVRTEFTTEETLLCRAEAKVHSGQIDAAIADFRMYEESRSAAGNISTLSKQSIDTYFSDDSTGVKYKPLNAVEMGFKTVDATNESLIHCALLYRRVETVHSGMRFFDLKRYGIEITHKIGKSEDVLKLNDPRRAIQIPLEVISAELEPNPRVNVPAPKIKTSNEINTLSKSN
jgi:tetratricopeptide (TPR) repeat protein